MRIKWKNVYWPAGHWVNSEGARVDIQGSANFRCKYEGRNLICIMKEERSRGGHGEPDIVADLPTFIDADTLKTIAVEGYIEIEVKEA